MAGILRAGLVGLGMMGRNHARVLRQLEGVQLMCIADPSGNSHDASFGIPVVHDVEELIAAGIDMAVVAAPTSLHEEVGLRLADAGVHTLIEKPLAMESAAALRLADAFDSRGLVGCVGHIERYNPAVLALRRKLDTHDLGEIYQVATRRQGPFPARIGDVGVTMDLATHDIDLTAWVSRQPYHTVSANTAHRSGREHEDLVAVAGRLANGTIVSHLVNWLSPMKERVTVVTGDRGCLIADTLTADLTFHANGKFVTDWDAMAVFRGVSEGDVIRYALPKAEPLISELSTFRDAVRGLPAEVVRMQEGATTVAVAEAILASAREQRQVTIESTQTTKGGRTDERPAEEYPG